MLQPSPSFPVESWVYDLSDLDQRIAGWASELKSPVAMFLSGEVGMGKTTFLKALGSYWGLADVTSPTYALHQEYQSPRVGIVHHFDMFRVRTPNELHDLGFYELMSEAHSVVWVEWPRFIDPADLGQLWQVWQLEFSQVSNSPHMRQLQIRQLA